MSRYVTTCIFTLFILLSNSCKKEPPTSTNNDKPVVNIISPSNNSIIIDYTIIEVEAVDDKGVVRVEIYVDNTLDSSRIFVVTPYRWTWNVQSLPDSSVHTIFAKAYDGDGNVSSSPVLNVKTILFSPSNLRVISINENAVVLQWQDNSRIETGFIIEQSINSIDFIQVDSVGADVTSATVKGSYLTTNNYYFRVAAKSSSGKSSSTNIVTASFSFLPPTNLTVTSITETDVQLQWQDNSDIETSFEIEQSTDGTNYELTDTTLANVTSAKVKGTYSTAYTYYFRVKASGKFNSSGYSNIAIATLSFPAPTNLTVTSITENDVQLQWQDNSTIETGFIIEQSINGIDFIQVDSVGADVTSATVVGTFLTTYTYYFRVHAKGTVNVSGYSNVVSATLVFPAPSDLTVRSVNENAVELQWKDNSNFEIEFEIEQSIDGNTFALADLVSSNETTATVSGVYLTTNSYYFRVKAKSTLNISEPSNGVRVYYVDELYAGGMFSAVGNITTNRIAKWDGMSWSEVGGVSGGPSTQVLSFGLYKGELYVGGEFTNAGGIEVSNIAKWNMRNWLTVGTGMNSNVQCFAVYQDELFAGGEFDNPGHKIARWNGMSWSEVGGGIDDHPNALIVYDNELYTGGNIVTAGGIRVNYIARWNGTAWREVGGGVINGLPNAFAVYNSELYVGGDFDTAGGQCVKNIARWNGTNWSQVGSGLNGTVFCLTVFNNELYAGGSFDTAGGQCVKNIARWNGNNWSQVGQEIYGTVHALVVYKNELYACDDWLTNRVAKWSGTSWSSVGEEMNGYLRCLTVYNNWTWQ